MKIRKVLISLLLLVFVSITVVALHSSLEYKIMAKTEALKNQLNHEYQVYSEQLYESVDVERSWYSLSPEDWIFHVTFKSNSETISYKYVDGVFVLSS